MRSLQIRLVLTRLDIHLCIQIKNLIPHPVAIHHADRPPVLSSVDIDFYRPRFGPRRREDVRDHCCVRRLWQQDFQRRRFRERER